MRLFRAGRRRGRRIIFLRAMDAMESTGADKLYSNRIFFLSPGVFNAVVGPRPDMSGVRTQEPPRK